VTRLEKPRVIRGDKTDNSSGPGEANSAVVTNEIGPGK